MQVNRAFLTWDCPITTAASPAAPAEPQANTLWRCRIKTVCRKWCYLTAGNPGYPGVCDVQWESTVAEGVWAQTVADFLLWKVVQTYFGGRNPASVYSVSWPPVFRHVNLG